MDCVPESNFVLFLDCLRKIDILRFICDFSLHSPRPEGRSYILGRRNLFFLSCTLYFFSYLILSSYPFLLFLYLILLLCSHVRVFAYLL